MRFVRTLALVLLASSLVHAQDMLPTLDLYNLKLGQVGRFKAQGGRFFFEIRQIRGEKEMAVAGVSAGGNGFPDTLDGDFFCVRGLSTKGLVDDKRIELAGPFKVSGTTKYAGRTVFLVEPLSKAEQAKFEAELQATAEAKAKERAAQLKQAAIQAKIDAERKAAADAAQAEKAALAKVSLARQYLDLGKKDLARKKLQDVIKDHAGTKAAEEAKELLKKL